MPSSSAACAMPSIAWPSSHAICAALGVAEVEAVGQRERLAAGARDVQRRVHHGGPAGAERIALAERRPVERHRDPAHAVDPQHGRVEARAGARCASRRAGRTARTPTSSARGSPGARPTRRWLGPCDLLDLVARALVGEQPGGDRADDLAVEEDAQLAVVGHRADHRARQLPLRARGLDVGQPLGRDDRDHPLLRLRDHDLPRLEVGLAQRHAVEVQVDARVAARHLGQRRREPGGAAVLQPEHEVAARRDRATPRSAPCRGTGRRSAPTGASRRSPRGPGSRARTRRRCRRGRSARRRARAGSRCRSPSPCSTRSVGSRPTHIALTSGFAAYASSKTVSPPTFGMPVQLP